MALERGEWAPEMEKMGSAFRKYRKERPKLREVMSVFVDSPPQSPGPQSMTNSVEELPASSPFRTGPLNRMLDWLISLRDSNRYGMYLSIASGAFAVLGATASKLVLDQSALDRLLGISRDPSLLERIQYTILGFQNPTDMTVRLYVTPFTISALIFLLRVQIVFETWLSS